jgi:hypothetical protein
MGKIPWVSSEGHMGTCLLSMPRGRERRQVSSHVPASAAGS